MEISAVAYLNKLYGDLSGGTGEKDESHSQKNIRFSF
jgi:hypothetical protein